MDPLEEVARTRDERAVEQEELALEPVRQDPADVQNFVPTAAMLAGDFSAITSPACNAGRTITLRAPYVNNRIDPALFSKPALRLASKLPQTADPCGKVIYSNPNLSNDHIAIGKIDYQKNAAHSIFGRYLIESKVSPAAFDMNHNPLSLGTADDALVSRFFTNDSIVLPAINNPPLLPS